MKTTASRALAAALAALAALTAGPLHAQQSLSLGETAPARVPEGAALELTYVARTAGFLSVVARSTAGEDISLAVADDEYQSLPGGEVDMDLAGDVGAEQLVVAIPRPGTYLVLVESLGGGSADVQVGGTFLASELAASAADPDGKPSAALELAVGASHEDTLDPSRGDAWDWYRIAVAADGVLTVLTRSDGDGDLKLEVFDEGAFREPRDMSDQDMDGMLGNESVTVNVRAGSAVYLRVAPAFGGGQAVAYRVASGLIPG